MRGESSGFGRWGGSIAFDSQKTWHFDHTTIPWSAKRTFIPLRFMSSAMRSASAPRTSGTNSC